eukprot:3434044-Rhodomonas_salina.1
MSERTDGPSALLHEIKGILSKLHAQLQGGQGSDQSREKMGAAFRIQQPQWSSRPTNAAGPAWLARHRETVESALCSVMNSLIAEQPASPLVFMAEKLLELAASQTIDDESHVALLREALQSMAIAEARTAKALTECIPTPAKSSRAGYLRALLEVIGDRPDHSWHQEWASMLMELKQNNGELKKREDGKWVSIRDVQWGSCVVAEGDVINEAWIEKHESISILSDATQSAAKSWTTDAIASMEGAGWTRVDAQRMVLLLVPRTAICRALRDQDRCYAAATYALCEVFATKAAEQGRRGLRPPVVYRLLCGSPSALAGADEALARLEEPDATGFRGLCSLLAVRGDSNP